MEARITVENRKRVFKSPSYRFGVQWIAINDDPGSGDALDVESVRGMVSVLLIADLFGCDPLLVASDVVSERYREAARKMRGN